MKPIGKITKNSLAVAIAALTATAGTASASTAKPVTGYSLAKKNSAAKQKTARGIAHGPSIPPDPWEGEEDF